MIDDWRITGKHQRVSDGSKFQHLPFSFQREHLLRTVPRTLAHGSFQFLSRHASHPSNKVGGFEAGPLWTSGYERCVTGSLCTAACQRARRSSRPTTPPPSRIASTIVCLFKCHEIRRITFQSLLNKVFIDWIQHIICFAVWPILAIRENHVRQHYR